MLKFFRRNSKRLLAVFGVVLMIAWFAPNYGSGGGLWGDHRRLVGYVGDEKVYDADFDRAKQQWELLMRTVCINVRSGQDSQWAPVLPALSGSPPMRILIDQVSAHPELYFLLQKEADRMGVTVSPEQVDFLFKNQNWAIQYVDGRIMAIEDVPNRRLAEACRDAVASFVRVQESLARAQSVVRISEPMGRANLAGELQEIKIRFVEFSAKEFEAKVQQPTDADLREQFERFADVDATAAARIDPATNPLGFGYKYSTRLTLQYIGVPRSEVRRTLRASQDERAWEVAARKHYLRNQNLYPSTQPASTTSPLSLDGSVAPATQPGARPFEEVREDIINQLLNPDVDRRVREVDDAVATQLASAWDAYHAAHPTTAPAGAAPTTAPSSADGYASYEFLTALAEDVRKATGILPTVGSIGKFSAARELGEDPQIGRLVVDHPRLPQINRAPISLYLTGAAAAQNGPLTLMLYQPAPLLRGQDGSPYHVRLTGVMPTARPQDIAEVIERVRSDWKQRRAYELALDAARALLDSAAASSFDSACEAARGHVVTSGYFRKDADKIENVTLEPAATRVLAFESFDLLTVAATKPSGPAIRIVEMPRDGRASVVELVSVRPKWQPQNEYIADTTASLSLWRDLAQQIIPMWWNYNDAVARLHWRDEATVRREKSAG
ncbi:MAG: hypothetical protein ACREJC_12090 [Tepidisphaeraceae bacterium]